MKKIIILVISKKYAILKLSVFSKKIKIKVFIFNDITLNKKIKS